MITIIVAVMFSGPPLERPARPGECEVAAKIKAWSVIHSEPLWIYDFRTQTRIYVRDYYCREQAIEVPSS